MYMSSHFDFDFLSYYCPNSQCLVRRWCVVETLQYVWRVARMTWSYYGCGPSEC